MRKAATWLLLVGWNLAMRGIASAEDYQAAATLARAVPAATDTEIDRVNWHCKSDKCVGTAARRISRDSRVVECRKVAAVFGKLTGFSNSGRELNARDLESCNRAAR